MAERTVILPPDDARWLAFAGSQPAAGPFHHPAWLHAIADTYGYEPFVFGLAAANGNLCAGVPLCSIGGRIRGRRWVALPFTDACQPLVGQRSSEAEFANALLEAQREQKISSIDIRAPLGGFGVEAVRGVIHRLELTEPDANFAAFESQVRRNIRKAEKSGVVVRAAEREEDLTDVYYALHTATRRRLGVPTQPRRFFAAIWRRLLEPGLGSLLLAYDGTTPIAGAVFLEWNRTVVYKFGASDERHWQLRPNNLIFWDAIRRGCETGAHTLDFGRSDLDGAGLRAFKASWGAREEPLVYATLGEGGESGLAFAEHLLRPVLRAAPAWVGRGLGEVFYRFAA